MCRVSIFVLATLLFLLPAVSQANRPAPNNPEDAQLITSDIHHFWDAFDAMTDGNNTVMMQSGLSLRAWQTAYMQSLYFERASPGLKDFIRLRISNADSLLDVILRHPLYYASLREKSMRVTTMEPAIRESFHKFKRLYPDAHFPNVYFVIGRMNSGGTLSDAGLMIGTEMYGLCEGTPTTELGEWHRQVLTCIDGIPLVVAHELIHFAQSPIPDDKYSLLAKAIREGSADFLAELIAGKHINNHIHEFCLPQEVALWEEFEEDMHGSDHNGWLYGNQQEGRPADIGYFIGYRIAQAYYNKAGDKKEAIREILHIADFNTFLVASGYAPSSLK